MGYYEEIFEGKTSFNEEEEKELNDKLKKNNWFENQFNEAKSFTDFSTSIKESKDKEGNITYESHLIKPIVAFLNSLEGQGTLFLGIYSGGAGQNKFLDVRPINKKFIKGEEHLRNLILSGLGIYPFELNKPQIDPKKITFKKGFVFVVDVKRTNREATYYSRITDYIYQRHNNQSTKLSLIESFSFINSKIVPRIYLKYQIKDSEPDKIQIDLFCENRGFTPGKYVTGIIVLQHDENITVTHSELELKENTTTIKKYLFILGYPPGKLLAYPGLPMGVGSIIVQKKDTNSISIIKFEIKIFEDKGVSDQRLTLMLSDNRTLTVDYQESFKTYI